MDISLNSKPKGTRHRIQDTRPDKTLASAKESIEPALFFPSSFAIRISSLPLGLHRSHQKRRVHRLEPQPLELVVAAGDVDHPDLRVAGFGDEDAADVGQVVDAADVGHQPPAGAEPVEGRSTMRLTCRPVPPTKTASGGGKAGPGFGGLAEHGREVAHAEPLRRCAEISVVVLRVHFDREDLAAAGDLRGLDGDRAAAGADVPDDARRADVHLRQGDRRGPRPA